MKKRILAGLIALASMACLLAGCGGEQSDGTVTNVSDEDFFLYKNGEVVDDTLPSEEIEILEDGVGGNTVYYHLENAGGDLECYKIDTKSTISNGYEDEYITIAEGPDVYEYTTSKGIGIGSTMEDFKEAYGDFPGMEINTFGIEWENESEETEAIVDQLRDMSVGELCDNYDTLIPSGKEVEISTKLYKAHDTWKTKYWMGEHGSWVEEIGENSLSKIHDLIFTIEDGEVKEIAIYISYVLGTLEE